MKLSDVNPNELNVHHQIGNAVRYNIEQKIYQSINKQLAFDVIDDLWNFIENELFFIVIYDLLENIEIFTFNQSNLQPLPYSSHF